MPSVLIVEDHAIMGQTMARLLGQEGNMDVCLVAPTAEKALEQLPQLEVALVLIDVSLPGMHGFDLLALLQEQHPSLPCLMLSGHARLDHARRALELGARGYVAKGQPFILLEAVQRVLAGEIYLSKGLSE